MSQHSRKRKTRDTLSHQKNEVMVGSWGLCPGSGAEKHHSRWGLEWGEPRLLAQRQPVAPRSVGDFPLCGRLANRLPGLG